MFQNWISENWCWLTQVVLGKRPLSWCSSSSTHWPVYGTTTITTTYLMAFFQVKLDQLIPPLGFSATCSGREPLRISGWGCLWSGCPAYHPTMSVKALKGTQSNDRSSWPGLILSSSTTGLLVEGEFLLSCQLSNASTRFFLNTLCITTRRWFWCCFAMIGKWKATSLVGWLVGI